MVWTHFAHMDAAITLNTSFVTTKPVLRIQKTFYDSYFGHRRRLVFFLRRHIEIFEIRKVFKQCVSSVMTYECQKRSFNLGLVNKLRVIQRAMEKAMFGVTLRDNIQKENICLSTRVQCASHIMSQRESLPVGGLTT
ncbi:hypothetical protein EVAR_70914_1 [Eumeta japonica]|uniref:Uncharacterized protein n=1 Tax=Eumeta variegata TaxID=151549 RepID=A0A4C2AD51_EUMVA|nr:hypothetical protein EVAR_70914_1 [Eumeta japonica]